MIRRILSAFGLKVAIVAISLFVGYLALISGLVGTGLEWIFGRPQAIAQDPIGEGVYTVTIIGGFWLIWWGIRKNRRARKAKREGEGEKEDA